jgi:hypothetical protein
VSVFIPPWYLWYALELLFTVPLCLPFYATMQALSRSFRTSNYAPSWVPGERWPVTMVRTSPDEQAAVESKFVRLSIVETYPRIGRQQKSAPSLRAFLEFSLLNKPDSYGTFITIDWHRD